ncbi:MAG: lipid-A-disaccharide synthase [Rhodospirillales bacterium]|nr:lipid-A-disaccharide synthase [Rhodospirillales bacterium]MBO6786746.1 lipid-A-disaccharide synthase [Rhodospirillales bacterium]
MAMSEPLHVYLIAGEPSGDVLGMRLMEGLKALTGDREVVFSGVGGPLMSGSGLRSLFPMNELTVMGLAEVLPRIPNILGRIRETADDIRRLKPDVVVTIDAPDFCFRVAKKLAGADIKIVHYVAPSVWAWRPGRAKKVARLVDHVMCLLPFEPPYFERAGVNATFVGHSILESGADKGDGNAFRERHGIAADERVLLALPGSRMSEISRLVDVFNETIRRTTAIVGPCRIVVPTLESIANEVRVRTSDWDNTLIIDDEAQKYDAFAAADAAIAASGTVSLELAMAGVPSLIAYRLSPLTAFFAKRLIRVKYASIVNLILDKPAIPEFLQENCTPETMTPTLADLLRSGNVKQEQMAEIADALDALKPGDDLPSVAAARVVLGAASK